MMLAILWAVQTISSMTATSAPSQPVSKAGNPTGDNLQDSDGDDGDLAEPAVSLLPDRMKKKHRSENRTAFQVSLTRQALLLVF